MVEKQLGYKYQVYNEIKKGIMTGVYPPGFVMNERKLSEELGISRTPIREGMQMLARDGWLQMETYKGTVVREFDPHYMWELTRVRSALELSAIEDAAKNITENDLKCLEEIQEKQKEVLEHYGSHSELTGEFAAIRQEMEQIAAFLGKKVLGQVTESAFWAALPALRKACGDRAVLRAIHYFEENARTLAQRDALQAGQFAAFAALVLESGRASFALCQNVYCSTDVRHQGLSVALALSQSILQGSTGAWRMQGGGFAGTIQAYVPQSLLERYHSEIERVFGKGSCYILRLREQGAVKVI